METDPLNSELPHVPHTEPDVAHKAARAVCDYVGVQEFGEQYNGLQELSDNRRRYLAEESRPILEMLGLARTT